MHMLKRVRQQLNGSCGILQTTSNFKKKNAKPSPNPKPSQVTAETNVGHYLQCCLTQAQPLELCGHHSRRTKKRTRAFDHCAVFEETRIKVARHEDHKVVTMKTSLLPVSQPFPFQALGSHL